LITCGARIAPRIAQNVVASEFRRSPSGSQNPPKRGAIDGLLKNGKICKSPINGVGAVTRNKDDRNAPACQLVGQIINQFASEIDIKDGSLKLLSVEGVDGLGHPSEGANH